MKEEPGVCGGVRSLLLWCALSAQKSPQGGFVIFDHASVPFCPRLPEDAALPRDANAIKE
jgi:hypothetical protein